jgi:hypothetical protein
MSEPGKDTDSLGVYLIGVDDFEWKPSAGDGSSSQPDEGEGDSGGEEESCARETPKTGRVGADSPG